MFLTQNQQILSGLLILVSRYCLCRYTLPYAKGSKSILEKFCSYFVLVKLCEVRSITEGLGIL